MKTLDNIKLIPQEILLEIANSDNENSMRLQKLLIVDDNNLDLTVLNDFVSLTNNELLQSEYISLTPVLDDNITNIHRNNFLLINIDEIDFSNWEDNTDVTGCFFIGTDREHAIINHKDSRLLEMIDCLVKIFDNRKLSTAGSISMQYASFVSYSTYKFGYKIVFKIKDQSNIRKAEI